MTDRSDLLAEANTLGLEFKKNISSVKLTAMVAEAKGDPIPVVEKAPSSPAVKPDVLDIPNEPNATPARKAAIAQRNVRRAKVTEAKTRAFETKIVTITNKDNRENDVMTTVYLAFENQHFGLAKLVPLDIPVELEAALIKIAAATTMTLHKDEVVNGQRTGNKVPTTVKKFAISYAVQ